MDRIETSDRVGIAPAAGRTTAEPSGERPRRRGHRRRRRRGDRRRPPAVAAGRSVLLVEALPRLGGRARTGAVAGLPLDLGCGWLHSAERNPLAALAAAEGVEVDRSRAAWGGQLRDLGASPSDPAAGLGRLRGLRPPAPPRSAGERPRRRRDGAGRPLAALRRRAQRLHERRRRPTGSRSRTSSPTTTPPRTPTGGFPAATAPSSPASARGCPPRSAPASPRSRRAAGSGSTPTEGRSRRGRRSSRSRPPCSRAAPSASTPPPTAISMPQRGCRSASPTRSSSRSPTPRRCPPESHLLGRFDSARTASYYLRPFGRPVVECFLGGLLARELEAAGEAAAVAFVRGELGALLGADFARGLAPLAITAWGREPTILGSYSHALPGAPTRAPSSPRRSARGSPSPARPARRTTSRPPTAPGRAGSPRRTDRALSALA